MLIRIECSSAEDVWQKILNAALRGNLSDGATWEDHQLCVTDDDGKVRFAHRLDRPGITSGLRGHASEFVVLESATGLVGPDRGKALERMDEIGRELSAAIRDHLIEQGFQADALKVSVER